MAANGSPDNEKQAFGARPGMAMLGVPQARWLSADRKDLPMEKYNFAK